MLDLNIGVLYFQAQLYLGKIMKKGKSPIKKLKYVGLHSDVSVYKTKFSITKNIRFSNTNRIANKFARVFKRLKPFKF